MPKLSVSKFAKFFVFVLVCSLFYALSALAITPPAVHYEGRGEVATSAFDRLPYLKLGASAHQVGSYNRGGNNADGSGYSYYTNGATGGLVVLEEYQPGTIYRIWATALNGGSIRIYFDGEATPRIDQTVTDFFGGATSPFLTPLVGNNLVSSGGYYSYYPISFEESIRIEFTNVPTYYNINYELYPTADGIATYTGSEDLSSTYSAWNNPTVDPKTTTGNVSNTLTLFDLPAGDTATLLNLTGQGSIRQVNLAIPQLITTKYPVTSSYQDNGRAFTGESNFTVAINPVHDYIELDRRFDYFIGDQKANVYVDGELAGEWFTPGNDTVTRWRISPFKIPRALTTGKSSISVRIDFVSSPFDWNEFYYWVKSYADGVVTTTDTLDVGDATSETAHSYTVAGSTFNGSATYTGNVSHPGMYDAATIDLLKNVIVKIYWDGEITPSVDVPLGFFFGQGASGEGKVDGLMVGNNPLLHTFYNYFPMPYGTSARIELVNNSSVDMNDASGSIVYNPDTYYGLGTDVGYFKAVHTRENPTTTGADFDMLTLNSGSGRVVGIQENIVTNDNNALEGDERIFIDNLDLSTRMHGTGTEDLFNGGFYFNQGMFSLPTHGTGIINIYGGNYYYGMYRWFIGDSIPFERGIKVAVEHGPTNDLNRDYEGTVFYYYISDRDSLTLSDTLLVGDATSETAHSYTVSGLTWTGSKSLAYFGRDDGGAYSGTGRAFNGYSEFTLSIPSDNHGIRLGRVFDHEVANQKALIYIDGTLAGTWFDGGVHLYGDYSFFEIPEALTLNKTSIVVKIQFVSSTIDWNEFQYTAYAHSYDVSYTIPTPTPSPTPTATPTPVPTTASSSTDNGGGGASSSSPTCSDYAPESPNLFQVNVIGTTAKLFFTPLAATSKFYISYAETPSAEGHGVLVDLAREGVQNFAINLLKPNTKYYFKIRGQNGCMPGPWGNIFTVKSSFPWVSNTIIYYLNSLKVGTIRPRLVTLLRPEVEETSTIAPVLLPSPSNIATPAPSVTQPPSKKCFLWWCW